MTRTGSPSSRPSLTLDDITVFRPAATPDGDPEPISGAVVARLLAAAAALDFANPDHQLAILEGVAELQEVLFDAVEEDGDAGRPGSRTGFLMRALLDALRLAMAEHSAERYGITGPPATRPRVRAPRDTRTRPAPVPEQPRRGPAELWDADRVHDEPNA